MLQDCNMIAPVTAIFDIGKTNKKFLLFDQDQRVVHEESITFIEKKDDDGFACDDLEGITEWVLEKIREALQMENYQLRAMNFSTYGATLVHLGMNGKPVTPLYNYLKPFPPVLMDRYFENYGGEEENNRCTASPGLGMLNSGLQLYWLKYAKPGLFEQITCSLHFPQYLSYLFTGKRVSEPTSIGCHTKLWDFDNMQYHHWLEQEGLDKLLPLPIDTGTLTYVSIEGHNLKCGVGVHDSSAALVPYLEKSSKPFLLVSTGTWSIVLNPFAQDPLTVQELNSDCLCFMRPDGKLVKASRLFLGNELALQVKKLNAYFNKGADYHTTVAYDNEWEKGEEGNEGKFYPDTIINSGLLGREDQSIWCFQHFQSFETAYHHLVWELVQLQVKSIELAKGNTRLNRIYVDGGFVRNTVFIVMLQKALPAYEIIAAEEAEGTALGAFQLTQE